MTLRFSQYLLSAVAAAFFVLCSLSSTAYAALDEYDFVDEEIRIEYESSTDAGSILHTTGVVSGNTTTMTNSMAMPTSKALSFFDVFYFYNDTESIIPKDYSFNVTFYGLVSNLVGQGLNYFLKTIDTSKIGYTIVLVDGHGTSWIANDATASFVTTDQLGHIAVDLNIPSVENDVYRIELQFYYGMDAFGYTADTIPTTAYNHMIGFYDFGCVWSFQEPVAKELPEILERLKSLPADLWAKFETGLQKLFVPGEEDMVGYKSKWEQLLEDHLGVIYQAGGVVGEYVEAFEYSEKSTIKFPPVTLHFGETEWTFGDWEVQIVPPGFDFLYTALRLITAFLATALFVNAMKRRFERLVGGDGNA